MPTATMLHADLDAFYASVEQLLDPRLRAKPIAVGGGVVLAASYEARAFGVRSGMPGRRARQLCPDLVFVAGHFGEYQRLGDAAIGVLSDFTPAIERISIDEAFADVAGCTHLFGSPAEIARTVRARVRAELGLPMSIGVARTKHLAKIASQVAKPDGLVVVDPDTELTGQAMRDILGGLLPWCRASQTLWPLLPTVENGDDLQTIASQPVGNHVPGARHHQFPCTCDSTRMAQIRQFSETLDCVEQRESNLVGGIGVVARNVRTEVSQMFDRSRRPDDDHARGAFRSRLRPHEWSQFATSLCGTPRPSSSSLIPL
jgi:impB/mucB/samB family